MLKLVGCILLSFSVWLFGRYMSNRIKHKMDVEDGILSLVEYIKSMINSCGMALFDIYRSVNDPRLEVSGFYETLHKSNYYSLTDALEKFSVHDCDKNVCENAKLFASSIGCCYCAEDAVILCDKYIALLKSDIAQIRIEDKKHKELYANLGLFVLAQFLFC